MYWLRVAADLVLPRVCPGCDLPLPPGAATPLCAGCLDAIPAAAASCARCAAPTTDSVCASCRTDPPAFAQVRTLGPYLAGAPGNALSRALRHLKYRGRRSLAAPLADLLAAHYPFDPDALVVPVPLHLSRLRARGYNQAHLLARGLARRRRLAFAPRLLQRTRGTREHAGLGAAARDANVRDAFRIRPGQIVAEAVVVLVDDVLTTGATANACARPLLAAGARRVYVYTVGRTP